MSDKGYAIMNFPKDCIQCEWSMYRENRRYGVCGLDKEYRNILCVQDSKPEWCPIKEFPKEDNENYFPDEFLDGMATGWNMCLKKIKGEEMNFLNKTVI